MLKMIRHISETEYDAIAEIFLTSRKASMPWLRTPHSDDEVREWFRGTYSAKYQTFVAEVEETLVGFAGITPGWLDHLYILPSHWQQGIGRQLFDKVVEAQPLGFQFWVFQKNLDARTFYESLGSQLMTETDGRTNEESEPDCLYQWRP